MARPGGMTEASPRISQDRTPIFERQIIAIPSEVSDLVRALSNFLTECDLCTAGALQNLEIVTGEILNNIAEHAYAGTAPGPVCVKVFEHADLLRCEFTDAGRAFPNAAPPDPPLPKRNVPKDSLPEGGFGWFMIRTLVTDLVYERQDGSNFLTVAISKRDIPQAQ